MYFMSAEYNRRRSKAHGLFFVSTSVVLYIYGIGFGRIFFFLFFSYFSSVFFFFQIDESILTHRWPSVFLRVTDIRQEEKLYSRENPAASQPRSTRILTIIYPPHVWLCTSWLDTIDRLARIPIKRLLLSVLLRTLFDFVVYYFFSFCPFIRCILFQQIYFLFIW